jgi:hypothetical protein
MKLIRRIILCFFLYLGYFFYTDFYSSPSICDSIYDKEELIQYLTDDKYKYWIVKYDNRKTPYLTILYYFDVNGKRLVFHKDLVKFEQYDAGDVVLDETWSFINNSIKINYSEIKIEKITDKEFIFRYLDDERNCLSYLVAAPDNMIPAEYRKMQ